MSTKLSYAFHKDFFDLEETVYIEFENPPYIPESKQLIDIDYHSFFDHETADKIVYVLERNKNMLPYKGFETWRKDGVIVGYEFMDITKKLTYKAG